MSSLEEIVASLELARLRLKLHQINKKMDSVVTSSEQLVAEIQPQRSVSDSVEVAARLSEFIRLREDYTNTLKMAYNLAKDNIPVMRAIQDSLDPREEQAKRALEFFTEFFTETMVRDLPLKSATDLVRL